jgi:ribose/xylose/arabinose/galactoside ABC-type transport system permease subunit
VPALRPFPGLVLPAASTNQRTSDILLQSSINTIGRHDLVIMTRESTLSVGSMAGLTSMITASVLPHNPFGNSGRYVTGRGLAV